jgi:hypothetical protein
VLPSQTQFVSVRLIEVAQAHFPSLRTRLTGSTAPGQLSLYGPRAFQVTNLAIAVLKANFCTKLDISNNDLQGELAELPDALLVNTSVKELNIAGNRCSHAVLSPLLGALKENRTLTSFDLSGHDELSDADVVQLAEIMGQAAWTSLPSRRL